jgi:hypothetical protein
MVCQRGRWRAGRRLHIAAAALSVPALLSLRALLLADPSRAFVPPRRRALEGRLRVRRRPHRRTRSRGRRPAASTRHATDGRAPDARDGARSGVARPGGHPQGLSLRGRLLVSDSCRPPSRPGRRPDDARRSPAAEHRGGSRRPRVLPALPAGRGPECWSTSCFASGVRQGCCASSIRPAGRRACWRAAAPDGVALSRAGLSPATSRPPPCVTGWRAACGTSDVLTDSLPGLPDGWRPTRRASSVALAAPRNPSSTGCTRGRS